MNSLFRCAICVKHAVENGHHRHRESQEQAYVLLLLSFQAQETYLYPHHHRVTMKPNWTWRNTCAALVTGASKAGHRSRNRPGQRLPIENIYGDRRGYGRTRQQTFIAPYTSMNFLCHLWPRFM